MDKDNGIPNILRTLDEKIGILSSDNWWLREVIKEKDEKIKILESEIAALKLINAGEPCEAVMGVE